MQAFEYLQDPDVFLVASLLVGLCVGSFLNVVVHRLPLMEEREWQDALAEVQQQPPSDTPRISLVQPRSRCPHCGHLISAFENIPIISYLFLRGRCSHCKAPISIRYPIVELITALLSAAVAWQFGPGWQAAGALLLVWALIALSFIDFDTQTLPDVITLRLVWVGLLLNLRHTFTSLDSAVIGAAVGYLSLWSVFWLYYGVKSLTNWLYKRDDPREGMGFGDFKLLAATGAFLGWKVVPIVILLSSVVGAVVGVSMILFCRHDRRVPIPFGPYLAAASVIALFFGDSLIKIIVPA